MHLCGQLITITTATYVTSLTITIIITTLLPPFLPQTTTTTMPMSSISIMIIVIFFQYFLSRILLNGSTNDVVIIVHVNHNHCYCCLQHHCSHYHQHLISSFCRALLTGTMDSIHCVKEQGSLAKGFLSSGLHQILIQSLFDQIKCTVYNILLSDVNVSFFAHWYWHGSDCPLSYKFWPS